MKVKSIFILAMILFNSNMIFSQKNYAEKSKNLNVKELFISQANSEGTLDTFDFLKIINGSDKERSFIDQNGNEINYLSFRKKVVLIDFWFLNCRPCIVELPALGLLRKKINTEEFEIITFANEPMEEIEEKLLSKKEFNFRIIPQVFLVSKKSYPLKMLVNKKSEIVDFVNHGNANQNSMNLLLDKYIPMIKSELRRN